MTKDMIPVASTSFCIQAYHAAHRRSRTLSFTLYAPISSKVFQYVVTLEGVRKVLVALELQIDISLLDVALLPSGETYRTA